MVAVVLILVVGPKDLPPMLRSFGRTVKKYRGMANDFKSQFNDALDESELDELRQTVADAKSYNPLTQMKDAVKEVGADINEAVDDVKPWTPKPEEISEVARSVGTKEAKAKATAARKSVTKKTAASKKTTTAAKKPTAVAKKPTVAAKKSAAVKPIAKTTVAKAPLVAKKPAEKTTASKSMTAAAKTTRKPRAAVAKKPAAPKGKAEAR